MLLHPILAVPLDAPALQTCLARLSNSEVDRLLTYLSKWVETYTQKLGEGAAQVPLPLELLFPTLAQVSGGWKRLEGLGWGRMVCFAILGGIAGHVRSLLPSGTLARISFGMVGGQLG